MVPGSEEKIHCGAAAKPLERKNGEAQMRARTPGMFAVVSA